MSVQWIQEPATVGEPGMLGASCGSGQECWLFNVFDGAGNLIYVEGSDVPVQQNTAWDCKWLCNYKPDEVLPKMQQLWNQFFSPAMAGKGPIVRAKRVRYVKDIVPPRFGCTAWNGLEETASHSDACIIYGRSKQVVTTTQAETPCPPYYKPVTQPDGTFKCVEQTCPPGTYIVKNPDGTAKCVPFSSNVYSAVAPNIPRLPFAPGQTVVTTPPGLIPAPPYRVAGPRAPCAPCSQIGRAPEKSTLGAAVEVATSGIIPAVLVLGVLGLAFYGFAKLMQRGGYEENPRRTEPISEAPRRRATRRQRRRRAGRRAARTRRRRRAVRRVRRRVRRALR